MHNEIKPDIKPEQQKGYTTPAISLPKSGGAIRGMGEKFAANPVTGTGSMSVPIATSPGRSEFGPQLSLSYDSGSGNGPFGFGWNLALPAITRKTDKGLPQYLDGGKNQPDSDVFILSGAEDLVPVLQQNAEGKWKIQDNDSPDGQYQIRRYRPRMEGLFARIERWTNVATGEIHWRSITRDNVTTLYGKDNNSRIFDPADPDPVHPTHIFSWLICQSYDDKGNAVVYEYAEEDDRNIDRGQANERNRTRTANRYLKRIRYGNRTPSRHTATGQIIDLADLSDETWMFEVIFDYGEGHYEEIPLDPTLPEAEQHQCVHAFVLAGQPWAVRPDPFSSYRAGFEVRTYRLCRRVLMFHHIPDLPTGQEGYDGLVRSTGFEYLYETDPTHARNPVYSQLVSVTQSGYKLQEDGSYLKKSLPPLEFEYTRAVVQDEMKTWDTDSPEDLPMGLDVDADSLENLPIGLDGALYQWTDLHGEGIPGILTEQGGSWFYKRNLSPINERLYNGKRIAEPEFAPVERVAVKPSLALAEGAQFMDLAGDGLPDLVVMDGPMPGLYEHDGDEGWHPFRPFTARLNRDTRDPNLRFIDLDGDGHADVLITEDDAFVWHASLAEEGFGPARRVAQALDEEKGPRLVFADSTQSIHLADLSGDGLTDLVRIRNGEVCYWPNLGYGRFGAKVTMDHAPQLDNPDQFDQQRIRLADIDGTGTTDIIYLHRDGVCLYFNQSGNSWSEPQILRIFPRVDDLVRIMPVDLLGKGTACLVWSSPLPGDARRPMHYVNLMAEGKPHLLTRTFNNFGAETRIHYAPSSKFYLQDKRVGKPWITRLPFPVHVVERVETLDHISRNRFVTRYAYHHGYFDGEEREFRGFGMVEQWDTEDIGALASGGEAEASNWDAAFQMPPVHTKTWFHTGAWLDRDHISRQFETEYYREPGLTDDEFRALLLPDTHLPDGLTLDEEREACRALKGMMLRQEVYADDAGPDASEAEIDRARTPYSVVEQDFTIRPLQPRTRNRHAVFFTHPREVITYHYERNPADPRVQHALTLEVDDYGNVLKEAAIGYGRRETIRMFDSDGTVHLAPNPGLSELADDDRAKQTTALITYTENHVTNAIDAPDALRTPLPCEALTSELTGYSATGDAGRYRAEDFVELDPAQPNRLRHRFTTQVAYEEQAAGDHCSRPIERLRILYRPDECGVAQGDALDLLPLGALEPLALPGESYQLAFTPGLLDGVFRRDGIPLLSDATKVRSVLGGTGGDEGGYVVLDGNGHWWIPSGRAFFSPDPDAGPEAELAEARAHFFLPRRHQDPFGQPAFVDFDDHDLLMVETRDALGNRVTVEANDYRVLQPRLVSDPNRNQTEVAFDALGLVVGTAVMGKPGERLGDSLAGFEPEPSETQREAFFGQPRQASVSQPNTGEATATVHELLAGATTRIVYDLDRFMRSGEPPFAATIARETHVCDLENGEKSKLQISFSYSDGFGREIQQKVQAEPGPLQEGGPLVNPRWIGSGWTIFNNKGQPVRQYEPFFDDTHAFKFAAIHGVSPVLFYDPVERVIATLHPNHTYEKVVFDPWKQTTWDVNDTVLAVPRLDPDVAGYVHKYFETQPADWQSWHDCRADGALGTHEQTAAVKAAAHADTPAVACLDTLGRVFMTIADNGPDDHGTAQKYETRLHLDIEGNPQAVIDARGNTVMEYAYSMAAAGDEDEEEEQAGRRLIYQNSMDAGERWMLGDVAGNPIRAWDSRGHTFTSTYDFLRRPIAQTVHGATSESDPHTLDRDILIDKTEYGEPPANASNEEEAQAQRLNLRTHIYRQYDNAGVITSARLDASGEPLEAYDFKGNPLRSTRQLVRDYKTIADWSQPPPLESEVFCSTTRYDALDRPIQSIATHSRPDRLDVIQPVFNEANLLDRLDVWLERAAEPDGLLDPASDAPSPVGVADIDYDAKGQRTLIDYKTRDATVIRTTYTYDRETFRLTHLYTRRGVNPETAQGMAFADDCENPNPPPDTIAAPEKPPAGKACGLQNLRYTYDPAGNITRIQDDAQQTIFFKNQRVEPSNDYTYDPLYRLIEATGREHLGQNGHPIPHSPGDELRVGLPHPGDGHAMGTYTERYIYDAVGNIRQMQHGWLRFYEYAEDSNRLSRTVLHPNGNSPVDEPYSYDAHGNMTRMPHLPRMQWDYRDQLRASSRQVVNNGGTPATTWYVYDASGERVRKVTESQAAPGETPTRRKERLYLGGFEIYREYGNDAETIQRERESLHVMDDQQRIALVETRTQGSDPAPRQLIRYQHGNHLGSASLELDETGQILSYEEYSPYGSTTYQATRTETPKRYRYTGKERDEETGLSYHGARYYAPWLGRWTAADPEGLVDGADLYVYARNNPVRYVDPNGMESFLCGKCVLPPLALQAALLRSEERSKDQYQVRNRFGGRRVVKSKMGPGTEGEKLLHIMEMAAREFPLRVRLFSAYRDSEGAHGEGLAVDIQIFDENGLAIASYQVPQTANIYALFALKARKIQMELYPELNDFFVWGGGWSGMKEGGGEGTYGAADWMHFEIRSPKRLREKGGMSVFSWEEGWLEGAGHYREGCFLGITGQVDLERDLKRLVGLTLSSDQRETQRKIGGEFPAGLSHRPIGPRLPVIPDLRLEFDPRPHFRPPESQPTTPIFWWEIPHPWHNILQ